jgi:hypothetical protein
MALPFNATTWKKMSDSPLPTIAGHDFTSTFGIADASYHAPTRVMQIYGRSINTFTGPYNSAAISFDNGKNWAMTYNASGVDDTYQVLNGFEIQKANGHTYYYQVRMDVKWSFFIADGSVLPGGISLWVADQNSASFQKLQDLYTWPHIIANPANTGGNNIFSTFPTVSRAFKIAGGGPAGEDAYFMIVAFDMTVGGTNNRQQFHFEELWRSTNFFDWEVVDDLTGAGKPNLGTYGSFYRSTTGRLIVAGGTGGAWTDDTDDLPNATWTGINHPTGILNGVFIPMYGGTWASARNGSLISGGFVVIACDDAANFDTDPTSPDIPLNSAGFLLKLGPSEALLITTGVADPLTQTKAWYSADGGETWSDGGVWLATTVGERPVAAFMRADGRPTVVTVNSVFYANDFARGVADVRTVCPLANAGLLPAIAPRLCGAPVAVNACD